VNDIVVLDIAVTYDSICGNRFYLDDIM